MDEDLLILLEPGIEGAPVEPHSAGQPVPGIIGVDPRGARPGYVAGPQAVLPGRSEAELLAVLLVHQHRGPHVADRDVVLGIVRPLPHVQRLRGVKDDLAAEYGADPAGNRLDVTGRHDLLRVVAHGISCFSAGASAIGREPITVRPPGWAAAFSAGRCVLPPPGAALAAAGWRQRAPHR